MPDFTTRLKKAASGFMYAFVAQDDAGTELFRFEATRLQHQRGGLLADVTVFSNIATARTVPGTKTGFVTRQTMDLLSARNKHDFGMELTQRIPAPSGSKGIDWALTVDEFTQKVLDADAERPTVIDLSEVSPAYETPYLVPYLLPENKATILYGAGGTGKSIFANALAAAVQTGCDFLGWPVERRNVLYLDWETDAGDLARRNSLVSAGLGLSSPAPVRYIQPSTPLTDHETLTHIASAVFDLDIGLIIIDSTVMAMPSNDAKDPAVGAREFFKAAKMFGVTVLAIDHIAGEDMRKGQESYKPYGSVFKWNIARNAFEFRYVEADDNLVLKHRKSNIGPKMKDKALTLTWNGIEHGGTSFAEGESFKYEMPTASRVLEYVREFGPTKPPDIMDALNRDGAYDTIHMADVNIAVKSLSNDKLGYHDLRTGLLHAVVLASVGTAG